MSRFIETIQLNDGKFLNLQFHQKRFERTFNSFFPGKKIPELYSVLNKSSLPSKGKYKITVKYSGDIENIRFREYHPANISALVCKQANYLDYSFKYSDRKSLNILREDVNENEDIIIIKNGFITDSSYANLAFYDGYNWFTPSTPLLKGTMREKLIFEGKIKVKEITVHDLSNFRKCSLINAMLNLSEVEIETANIRNS